MTFPLVFTLLVTLLLVTALYLEFVNPAVSFFLAAVLLVIGGIISPTEAIQGLANQQIIIIFLLVAVSSGVRSVFGEGLFSKVFRAGLEPRNMLLRMMVMVSSVSAFLNNTPIVALMIPYVRDWCRRNGQPVSRFLIPLSYATILGGMITVIGTSTNLVLSGLIEQHDLPVLHFTDFLFLGLIVTVLGWFYLYFIAYPLLPAGTPDTERPSGGNREYLVEAVVKSDSRLAGSDIRSSGLLNLHEVVLLEIHRDGQVIAPVLPQHFIQSGDRLYFSGHMTSIQALLQDDNGVDIRQADTSERRTSLQEAVIPAGSHLAGTSARSSDFRQQSGGTVLAIHRNGKRMDGDPEEIALAAGDFLLILSAQGKMTGDSGGLVWLDLPADRSEQPSAMKRLIGFVSLVLLMAGITNVISLFLSCLIILSLFIFTRVLRLPRLRAELDAALLVLLVCSLAVGTALEHSGAARWIAAGLIEAGKAGGPASALTALFLVTTLLTAVISNTAVVALVFPVALSMASQLSLPATPFFVAVAFAASGDFATPIGYQTNMMVYGAGGYRFRDFMRVGGPLTLLYMAACITFIALYYDIA